MARILIRVLHPTFSPAPADKLLSRNLIGKNVGNYAFSFATERQLNSPLNQLTPARIGPMFDDTDNVNRSFDNVVMPLANHFRASNLKALHNQAAAMEKLNIPITVLGVGGQADLEGTVTKQASDVAEATKRFVRAALRNSPSIGVRGEYTKQYLVDLGFDADQVDIVGCPSLFLRGDDLPLNLPAEIDPEGPIAFNLSHYLEPMGPILLENLKRYPQLTYFGQDINTLRLILKHIQAPGATQMPSLPLRTDHPAMAPGRSTFALNMPTWMEALSQRQMSFGSRIHGNIVALLAGTPAIVLAHDSRTLELARYHEIPHFKISDLSPDEATAEALYARADYTGFLNGHAARFQTYKAFLDKHGLPNIFGPEGGGEAFDERVRNTRWPAPVVSTGMMSIEEAAALVGTKKLPTKKNPLPQSRFIALGVRVKRVLRKVKNRLKALLGR